ncbi:MAG: hypothetical protein GWN21_16715, partial [Gammaproteobacteria bacterium]|nr:hypothetical protein [Gammaproteobacteria bacterium]NIR88353.1 hypothetical protein [Gammaproteobacteria bacterium]NIU02803.1 hypothetical protein [Gammaproteobacteria bacterium]NIV50327.1 hypothetical protein [Gammaproteobacteria bacterium]NIW56821.1 hypothetical protein [Gammaproteobacteria bacterium]
MHRHAVDDLRIDVERLQLDERNVELACQRIVDGPVAHQPHLLQDLAELLVTIDPLALQRFLELRGRDQSLLDQDLPELLGPRLDIGVGRVGALAVERALELPGVDHRALFEIVAQALAAQRTLLG